MKLVEQGQKTKVQTKQNKIKSQGEIGQINRPSAEVVE